MKPPFWLDDRVLIGAVFEVLTELERTPELAAKLEPMSTDIVEGQALRLLPLSKMLERYGYSYEWIPHILDFSRTLR